MSGVSEETPSPVKVLFVDDEENVLRALRRTFSDEDGISVFTASSGPEGLELLREHSFHVIVSDQRMPGMSGAEFLARARDFSPDPVRIVLTGYADITATIDLINRGGASRYLTKPWNEYELVSAVRDGVEKYRLVTENRRLLELTRRQNEELKKWSDELQYYVQQQTIDLTKRNKELVRLAEKLKKNFRDTISMFLNIIELRDRLLYTHSVQTASLSTEIARILGLSPEEIDNITIAAQLHDIGTINMPDVFLIKKTAEMNPSEQEEFLRHPIRGQSIVGFIEDLKEVGILIRHHHESYNGRGFPDRLKSDSIPLGSRIISLCDRFDWFRMQYGNDTKATEKAFETIRSLVGRQLDPLIFDSFAEVIRTRKASFLSSPGTSETETGVSGLSPGMVLARDVRSGTGLLLLSKGTVLNEKMIEGIRRNFAFDPSGSGIFITVGRVES